MPPRSRVVADVREAAGLLSSGVPYAILIGAGGSTCSSIPTAEELVRYLRRTHPTRDLGLTYGEVMQRAFKDAAERRVFFEEQCAGKVPCGHHYRVAELAERGILPIIYTTNFDRLIETALFYYCSTQPAVYLHDVELGDAELLDANTKILKLHGDFLFEAIANLPRELRRKLHEDMRRKLHLHLVERGLVVVGYGGRDRTIMSVIEEAVRNPRALPGGLVWITRREPAPEVLRLLDLADRLGKKNLWIRTSGADEFFETLCETLGVKVAQMPRFGLRHDERGSRLVGNTYPFAHARQSLPMDTEDSVVSPSLLVEISQSLARSEALWVVGPEAPSVSALARAVRTTPERPLFYFDSDFARNQPPSKNLRHDVAGFAAGLRIGLAGKSANGVVRQLFKRNAIFVLANSLECEDNSTQGLGLQRTYWGELLAILAALRDTGSGSIVLLDRCAPPAPLLERTKTQFGIKLIHLRTKTATQRVSAPNGLSDDERAILDRLRVLRFAETKQTLARLIGQEAAVVDAMASRGFLTERSGRFRLRSDLFPRIRPGHSREEHIAVAEVFEKLSKQAARGHDVNGDHYTFESEYHFYAAEDYVRAARMLTRIGLDVLAQTEWASWVATTLGDFFRLEGSGHRVVTQLRPPERHALLRVFDVAIEESNLLADPLMQQGRALVIRSLPRAWRLLDEGYALRGRGDYAGALQPFEQLVKLTSGDPSAWKLRGAAEGMLGACYISLLHHGNGEALKRARAWCEAAVRTFRNAGDEIATAIAMDNLAYCHLARRDHRAALALLLPALHALRAKEGLSRDKAVIYGNVALAHLLAGQIDRAEGYFLESALHYAAQGDFDGGSRLYLMLFEMRGRLASRANLSPMRLYDAAFRTWGYARPPLLLNGVLTVNEQYLDHTLRSRDASEAARAIDDRGYILRDAAASVRIETIIHWVDRFAARFGEASARDLLMLKLRSSGWWPEISLVEQGLQHP